MFSFIIEKDNIFKTVGHSWFLAILLVLAKVRLHNPILLLQCSGTTLGFTELNKGIELRNLSFSLWEDNCAFYPLKSYKISI